MSAERAIHLNGRGDRRVSLTSFATRLRQRATDSRAQSYSSTDQDAPRPGALTAFFELPAMNCPRLPRNQCDSISRAAGAAAGVPKPPGSTAATTRIGLTGSET